MQQGLKEIEISPALMAVSSAHVKDLNANRPHGSSGCNLGWKKGEKVADLEFRKIGMFRTFVGIKNRTQGWKKYQQFQSFF